MKLNAKTLMQEQYLIPVKIVSVYLAWKVFHYFTAIPGSSLNLFWSRLVLQIGSTYASAACHVLSAFGMASEADGININLIASHRQIWVQEHCLAIPAMIVITGAVIFFRGVFRDKVVFLALCLTGIILINLIRLILVSLAWVYLSDYFFRVNHIVIYVAVMYGFIFYMVTRWMNYTIEKGRDSGSNPPAAA